MAQLAPKHWVSDFNVAIFMCTRLLFWREYTTTCSCIKAFKSHMQYPVSDGGRGGQSCIFFEFVLAKKVRTDPPPRPPSLDHYHIQLKDYSTQCQFNFTED